MNRATGFGLNADAGLRPCRAFFSFSARFSGIDGATPGDRYLTEKRLTR